MHSITGFAPIFRPWKPDHRCSSPYISKRRWDYANRETTTRSEKGNPLEIWNTHQQYFQIEQFIATNFTMPNRKTGKNENFREFCYSFCQLNDPIVQFTNGFLIQNSLAQAGEPLNDRINLSYPMSYMYGRRFNIQVWLRFSHKLHLLALFQPSFFGLEFYDQDGGNSSSTALDVPRITNLK